jgi:hypothetical protein
MGWQAAGMKKPRTGRGGVRGSGGLHVGKAHVEFFVVDRVIFGAAEVVLDAIEHGAVNCNAFAADCELLCGTEGPLDGGAAAFEDLGFDLAGDGLKSHGW